MTFSDRYAVARFRDVYAVAILEYVLESTDISSRERHY